MQTTPGRRSPGQTLLSALAVLHPFFFAAAFVLDRFALTNSSASELVRPLLVSLGIAGVMLLVGLAVFRRGPSAALAASTGLLVLVIYPVPALVMLGAGAWWVAVSTLRRRRTGSRPVLRATDPPVMVAIGYSIVLLVVAAWSSGSALVPQLNSRPELPVGANSPVADHDIYLLLLDGYPRSDTLADEFDFDNSGFEADLGVQGFEVASDSEANYNKTWLTVASLLNARYVHDLPEIADPPDIAPAQARIAEELINAGAVLERLRARGYEIVSIPSPVPTTDVTVGATVRQPGNLSSFEIALVTASLPSWLFPGPMLDLLASDAEGYVRGQLDLLSEAAASSGAQPRLVLAHLMSPHPPFVLGQEPDYLRDCFPRCKVWETTVEETGMTDEAYAERLRIQTELLNGLVISVVTEIATENPDATVIVMSDHGARHHIDNIDEHFRNFFAARAGAREVSFPEDIAPVNVFRRILSADDDDAALDDLPYEAWGSDWVLPLLLTRHR